MAYRLNGRILEVCDCNVLCPCWVGEDPDNKTCNALIAWHMDRGFVDDVDVSGCTIAVLCAIPGNVLDGEWRVAMYVNEEATVEQERALLDVFSGKQGGPVADLVGLFGDVVSLERAPIRFAVSKGKGVLRIGSDIGADIDPLLGGTGGTTAMTDTVFSTIPGSPAYVGKASRFRARHPALPMDLDLQGHNAVQGSFLFEG